MEQPAWRGNGVIGWLRRRAGKGASIPAAMVEELFWPHRHQARETVQEQRQAAAPVPAPGEPADLSRYDRGAVLRHASATQ